jgi:hypothetical protein
MNRKIPTILAAVALTASLGACANREPATPAPVVTVTEQAPAPEPTEEDITQSAGYLLTQTLMEDAWNKQSNPELLCIVWATQRQKWLGKFVSVAVNNGVPYDEATAAVEDFFDGKCASDV